MKNSEEIKQCIIREFETGVILKENFPMLVQPGLRDYSETFHSAGLNYITQIGRSINGVVALSECPVYGGEGEYRADLTREVRPDSIWFDKLTMSPLLVSEFERYEKSHQKNRKLQEKIENLLIAYHQLGGVLPLILFAYWTYNDGTIARDIDHYTKAFDDGFQLKNGKWIPGIDNVKTQYIVYQAVASGTKERLTINKWIRVR